MSNISILACLIYGMIALLCLAPAVTGSGALRRHWLAAAALMVGLIAMRLAGGEDRIRQAAREMAMQSGNYASRWEFQIPLALGVALAGTALLAGLLRHWRAAPRGSRQRLVIVSRFGMLGLLLLYALRLVSLHQIDAILYAGPLRLNWIFEGFSCLAIALPAFLCWRQRGGRTAPKRR